MEISRIKRTRRCSNRAASLVPGQTVRGRVIADLGDGRFRVGAAGQVFEATSDLPLDPGQKLYARVEVEGWRVLLRILKDAEPRRRPTRQREDPAEIRRVLIGLGHKPSTEEVAQFQRRLERYAPHGYMPDYEPSDVWVMAILWTRGIRSGADSFALLSFYLRQLALEKTSSNLNLPPPAMILDHFCSDTQPSGASSETSKGVAQASEPESLEETHAARKAEAAELLNSKDESPSRYFSLPALDGTFHLLSSRDSNLLTDRWTDNPALPDYVIDAKRSESAINLKLNALADSADSFPTGCETWKSLWDQEIARRGLADAGTTGHEVVSSEELRVLFWRNL